MQKNTNIALYIIGDFLIAFFVWLAFFLIRRNFFEVNSGIGIDEKFISQLPKAALAGFYWVALLSINNTFIDPYRKSRLSEAAKIFKITILGVLFIFFVAFLDDERPESINRIYLIFFLLQWGSISAYHFFLSSIFHNRISSGKVSFPTVVLGNGPRAEKLIEDINNRKKKLGLSLIGQMTMEDNGNKPSVLPILGKIDQFTEILQDHKITEVLISLEEEESNMVNQIINQFGRRKLNLKIIPELIDKVSGSIKKNSWFGSPLIEINFDLLSPIEKFIKRSIDLCFSTLVVLLLSPLFLIISIFIKRDSSGPVFFLQERIGKDGKPFNIIKFRTMVTDAEKAGPALSSDHDPRITRVGKFLRKSRLDETPQFINVIRGDMSIIGPRPERQHFIDQIVKKAPQYLTLQKVRPGITSWGMVRYGYAENVDQMIERMKYDFLYLENISLFLDLKIVVYTIQVMIEGRGK